MEKSLDWPFVHKEKYAELTKDFRKIHEALCNIFHERDSNRIVPCFKDGWEPPKEIKMRTISEEDFNRLQRLDKIIDETRIKIYG